MLGPIRTQSGTPKAGSPRTRYRGRGIHPGSEGPGAPPNNTVVVEGVLPADQYTDMLASLTADHRGISRCYYFDVPFEETLVRHATKPGMEAVYEEHLREWWSYMDLLPGGVEEILGTRFSAEEHARQILHAVGLERDPTGQEEQAEPAETAKEGPRNAPLHS
ncbi:hypothetical protein GCM10009642_47110 [Nocardiopsis metallicus]